MLAYAYDHGGWWRATIEGEDDGVVRVRLDDDWSYYPSHCSVAALPPYCIYSDKATPEKRPHLCYFEYGEIVTIIE